jgi:biotin transport system substrate-specific component
MQYLFQVISAKSKSLTDLWIVLGGVALLFAGSQIEIPVQPVPITLQTVAVMLIGLTYSPRKAFEAHLLWLGLACVGLPVLSGFGSGFAHLTGPTAGYLIGFVVSATLMAFLKEKLELNSMVADAVLCLVGTGIVFTFGLIWLSKLIGFNAAVTHGFMPFILPGFLKAGILCSALQIVRYWKKN